MTMNNIFRLEPNSVHELVRVLVRLLVSVLALALVPGVPVYDINISVRCTN